MLGPKRNMAYLSRFTSLDSATAPHDQLQSLDEEMTELALLVPEWQAQSLEAVARAEGVSAGQIVRRLIQEYCGVRLNRFAVE